MEKFWECGEERMGVPFEVIPYFMNLQVALGITEDLCEGELFQLTGIKGWECMRDGVGLMLKSFQDNPEGHVNGVYLKYCGRIVGAALERLKADYVVQGKYGHLVDQCHSYVGSC